MSANIDELLNKVLDKDAEQEEDLSLVLDEEFLASPSPPDIKFANVARKKLIESRLAPLRIEDMYLHGECRQSVEIIPGRLSVVFRTPSGAETLYIRRKLGEARTEINMYVNTYHSVLELCSYIHSLNGEAFPTMVEKGVVSEDAFKKRQDRLSALPQLVLEDIWVNQRWFLARVRAAATADNLKGG
jgi:hypothetical protein